MINIYNESALHRELKEYFRMKFAENGEILESEKKIGEFYCDLAGKKSVVEIQNAGISRLRKKLDFLLENYDVTVVYPVVRAKTILTYDAENNLISRRKSPKHSSVYEIFFNMTGLVSLVPHPRLKIVALDVEIEEIRRKFGEKVQLKNKSRRHLRDWEKIDKKLVRAGQCKVLCSREDYISLLGNLAEKEFSSSDIKKLAGRDYSVMIWFYKNSGFIESVRKEKNALIYKVIEGKKNGAKSPVKNHFKAAAKN